MPAVIPSIGQKAPEPIAIWNPKRWLVLISKILISGTFVALILRRIGISPILQRLEGVTALPIIEAGFVCIFLSPPLFAWRWEILAEGSLSFSRALKFTWIGFLFTAILPGFISGDVAKGVSLAASRRSARNADMPASILLERFTGLAAIAFLFLVTCAFLSVEDWQPPLSHASRLTLNVSFVVSAFVVMIFAFVVSGMATNYCRSLFRRGPARLFGIAHLATFLDSVAKKLGKPRVIAKAVLVSTVIQAAMILQTWLLLRSIDVTVNPTSAVLIQIVVTIAAMLPVSIAGIGVREWFTASLFPVIGLTAVSAVAYSWLCVACALLLSIGGGLVQVHELFNAQRAAQ